MVAVAVLGGLGLTACRSQPSVAVYLGKTTISQAWVDQAALEVWDEVKSQQDGTQVATNLAEVRQAVIRTKILDLIARDAATRDGLTIAEPTADEAEAAVGSMASSPKLAASDLVKLRVSAQAAMTAVQESLEPAEPTEADQREVYDSVVKQNLPVVPFEDAKPSIDKGLCGKQIALRDVLRQQIQRFDITVNPRYAPVVLSIDVPVNQQVSASLSIPLAAHQ